MLLVVTTTSLHIRTTVTWRASSAAWALARRIDTHSNPDSSLRTIQSLANKFPNKASIRQSLRIAQSKLASSQQTDFTEPSLQSLPSELQDLINSEDKEALKAHLLTKAFVEPENALENQVYIFSTKLLC